MSKVKGIIKFFNKQKGFGFITPENGNKDIFVHITNVEGDPSHLKEGQKVEFTPINGRKGQEATQVSVT